MKNAFQKKLLKPILKKNKVFNNQFKDKTCYIFGNGASLKYIDFNYFKNYPSIGINHLILHKDFNLLNICCYTLPEPMSFYSYFKNPYKRRYEKNIMGRLFRSQLDKFPNIKLFTSYTNILGTNFSTDGLASERVAQGSQQQGQYTIYKFSSSQDSICSKRCYKGSVVCSHVSFLSGRILC